MNRRLRDRGAAAVEFALVVPILIALVLAIAVFGRAYNIQSSLSMAAREGVRVMAIEKDAAAARTAASIAAMNLGLAVAEDDIDVTGCDGISPSDAIVTVPYNFDFFGFGGFLLIPESVDLTGKGVMRCGG